MYVYDSRVWFPTHNLEPIKNNILQSYQVRSPFSAFCGLYVVSLTLLTNNNDPPLP